MERHDMPVQPSAAGVPCPRRQSLDRPPPLELRVDDVFVHHSPESPGPGVVVATIEIPELLPGEVVVELTLLDDAGRPLDGAGRRMWSEHAYEQGAGQARWMFVARVSAPELASAQQAVVTVRASGAGTEMSAAVITRSVMPLHHPPQVGSRPAAPQRED